MRHVEDPPTSEVRNAQGNRLYYDPRDGRGARLRESGGDINPDSLRLWNLVLGLAEWELVVDVGSNYGEMIVGAALPETAHVVAFEPNPAVLPYLHRTLDDFGRPVELIEAAVSDRRRAQAAFGADAQWSGTSKLASDGESPAEQLDELTVRVTSLSDEFRDRPFRSACIKVDVEGGEDAVLHGATPWLRELDQWAMMLEILHMSEWQVASLARVNHLFLLDNRIGHLVAVPSSNPSVVRRLLESDWLYRQDAVLLSSPRLGAHW